METLAITYVIWMILYFAPSIIAARRGHNSHVSVFILNLFLGWTVFFWIVCLAWAFSSDVRTSKKGAV